MCRYMEEVDTANFHSLSMSSIIHSQQIPVLFIPLSTTPQVDKTVENRLTNNISSQQLHFLSYKSILVDLTTPFEQYILKYTCSIFSPFLKQHNQHYYQLWVKDISLTKSEEGYDYFELSDRHFSCNFQWNISENVISTLCVPLLFTLP